MADRLQRVLIPDEGRDAPACQATFAPDNEVTLFEGDRLDLLASIPDEAAQLVVTSPPYNIGKEYEERVSLEEYCEQQRQTIREAVRVLAPVGSICWQVGNHIGKDGEVYPLDAVLYPTFKDFGLHLRNRIVWHFGHGLHCTRRYSGRHETIVWFTKTDDYVFDLDAVRVPQKYPGKRHFKGPKAGELSGNPRGKNPTDVWDIPNVKANHVEKTEHPCQFPVEVVERLVLSLSERGALVIDPYIGVGTTAIACIRHGRRCAGADLVPRYLEVARERVSAERAGVLPTRPMGKPVYKPPATSRLARLPTEWDSASEGQGEERGL